MSDQKAEQQDDQGESQEPEIKTESNPEVETLREKLAALEASKLRVEEESRKNKQRRQELEAEIAMKQESDLKAKGKIDELLELERKKTAMLEDKIRHKDSTILDEKLRIMIGRLAPDANDQEDIYDLLPEGVVSINRESMTISGVEEAIDQIRKKKSYLFKRPNTPAMESRVPTLVQEKERTLAEMTREEKHQAVLKNHK